MDPKIAQKSPIVMDMEPGKKAWCACGLSDAQPFCNGAHKGSGLGPIIETISENKKVAWCGCKHSSNPPYCDGTHSRL